MHSLLKISNLTVHYSRSAQPAVRDVSFGISAGETVGLMGQSGCGKTSLAMALLGLLPGDRAQVSGSVCFRGRELSAMKERELRAIRGARISIVFQEPELALNPVMRAGDQVAEVIYAHRDWSWTRCREEASSMLDKVGLGESRRFFNAYPHQLSGGQRQRVTLAQALACGPELLIADEPTASLDARSQRDFLALLQQMKDQFGIAVLLINHSPEVQASISDRLLVMAEGRIIEEGSFRELYRHSKNPHTRAMLRAGDRDGTSETLRPERVGEFA
jgi:peptide/nickel transport system ATP-binding protein